MRELFNHPTELLENPFPPRSWNGGDGYVTYKYVRIDELMVPVIKALWTAGIETVFCCQGEQGHKYGAGYVQGPNYSEAEKAGYILVELGLTDVIWRMCPEDQFENFPWIRWEYNFEALARQKYVY